MMNNLSFMLQSKGKRTLSFIVTALTVVGLTFLNAVVKESAQPSLFSPQPAIAQSVTQGDVSQQVYQQLPSLPMENQYVNKETGKIAPNNTLVSRLLRYHIYLKGRPPNYRLDWKLTLADYLDANELMEEAVYPGYDTLRKNPMEGDRAAIGRLNRPGRDALVQTLVSIFNANYPATSDPAANASPQPSTAPRPISPRPQPGDAQRLMP